MSNTPELSFTSASRTSSGSNLTLHMGPGSPAMPLCVPPEGLTISASPAGRVEVRRSGVALSRAVTLVEKARNPGNTEKGKPHGALDNRRGSEATLVDGGEEPEHLKVNDLGRDAVRWARRYSYHLLLAYYIVFTLLLLVPSILTPTLVWFAIAADVDAGFDNPAATSAGGRNYLAPYLLAYDRVLTVAVTGFAIFNMGLTLTMRGLDLISPPWAQNLLTAIGVMATVSAVRNSIQLPMGVV